MVEQHRIGFDDAVSATLAISVFYPAEAAVTEARVRHGL